MTRAPIALAPRLCYCTVSDRASAGARLALRLGRGEGPGEMPAEAAALAIRGCRVGTLVGAVEGVLGAAWSGSDGSLMRRPGLETLCFRIAPPSLLTLNCPGSAAHLRYEVLSRIHPKLHRRLNQLLG